ncbi:MAG: hypothetical protein ACRDIX_04885 [Actinomycetota bacterium]
MKSKRVGLGLGLMILLACGPAASESEQPDELDQFLLTDELASRMRKLIMDRDLPYSLTQAEFQEFEGDLVWVYQFDDPAEASPPPSMSFEDLVLYEPLRLYRDAVAPSFENLKQLDVELFILSFRDPEQTVFEIDPLDLQRYIEGQLTDRQFARSIRITGL